MRIPAAALRFRPTNDMWTALKMEPPVPAGRGGAGRTGGPSTGSGQAPGAAPAGATPAATQNVTTPARGGNPPASPTAAPARGGDAGANPFQAGGREGGREGSPRTGGRQGGGGMSTLTPEQQKQLAAIRELPRDQQMAAMAKLGINFGGRGGGQGRGGRAGNAGQSAPVTPIGQRGADSIDELFPELVRQPSRGQVYVLRPADATHPHGKLERLDIQQGISDNTFTELVSGPAELAVGTELISNILMPWLKTTTTPGAAGSPFGGQQPGRGMMPQGMPTGGGGRGGGGR